MEGNVENNYDLLRLKGKIFSIPTIDASLTKEGYAADSKVVGDALSERVKKDSIVDNLESDLIDAPLSARQGKVIKEMLDECTKPFGQYTGNGSASPRTIETEGTGSLLLVYSDTGTSLVTPKGSLTINISDGSMEWISEEKVHYLDGKLALETPSVEFNALNTSYYYQVI